MDTGRVEVGEAILRLFGIDRDGFDGRVETLLGRAVPEDLPALMSVVEADHMSIGDRELEFRIRQPGGPPAWLRLRGRLQPGGEGRPARLVGTVVDASTLRADVTDVARVQRLAAALATAGTVKDVGQAVVAALRKPLQADRIALAELENDRLVVTVLDPPEPEAWPEVWRSEWRTEWPDAPVRAMPTLAAALREGRARIWPAGSPLEPALAEVGPGGLAVLPLPAGSRMAGACLIGWDRPHEFAADERALLTACAGLAGQALLRAHAFDAEHELVGMLQRTLLPRRLPRLPGAVAVARYLPTTAGLEVGGDWYDVIPLADNHVALVIGDVQGHNAGAATLMGQMRTALRAYAAEGHAPDVVVALANRLLLDMETDLFATCGYVDVDMEEGTAWCVRAGHLQPVLRHPDGTAEIVRAEGGPPLGVLAQAEFPMTPLRLQPGTVLALTTDGLVESPGADLDAGMDRLARELAAADPRPPRPGRRRPAHRRPPRRRRGAAADALRRHGRTAAAGELDGVAGAGGGPARPPLHPAHPACLGRVPRTRSTRPLLVVSELVTNALVHTGGQVRLDLSLVNHRLRLAVADSSPRSPVKPTSIGWGGHRRPGHPAGGGRVGGVGDGPGQRRQTGLGGPRTRRLNQGRTRHSGTRESHSGSLGRRAAAPVPRVGWCGTHLRRTGAEAARGRSGPHHGRGTPRRLRPAGRPADDGGPVGHLRDRAARLARPGPRCADGGERVRPGDGPAAARGGGRGGAGRRDGRDT